MDVTRNPAAFGYDAGGLVRAVGFVVLGQFARFPGSLEGSYNRSRVADIRTDQVVPVQEHSHKSRSREISVDLAVQDLLTDLVDGPAQGRFRGVVHEELFQADEEIRLDHGRDHVAVSSVAVTNGKKVQMLGVQN